MYSALHNSVNTPIFLAPALGLPKGVGGATMLYFGPQSCLAYLVYEHTDQVVVSEYASVSHKSGMELTNGPECG